MAEYTAADGMHFTDQDMEKWAAQTERGYTGGHLGRATAGRPVSVGQRARPFTLRLDTARRAKLDQIAHQRETSVSQLVRDLIDAL
jgi:predicted transcriptional regulator